MATDQSVIKVTYPAAADLSAKQYFFMQVDSNGRVNSAGDGEVVNGVLYNDPAAIDRAAEVAISGRVKVIAGGTVTAGTLGASDSAGEAVAKATGDIAAGMFITGGANGDIVEMQLNISDEPLA